MTTTPAEGLVAVRDLNVYASDRAGDALTLVSPSSFSVAPGEAVAIVGESGSGKTMTARSLVGLLPAGVHADGSAVFGDADLLKLRGDRLHRLRGREISLLMQDPHTMLNPLARAGDQIADGLRLAHPEWSKAQIRRDVVERLAEVGIDDETVFDRRVFQLSGGMKQRVALAAALAQDPALLIADEPTSALDVVTQRAVLSKLRQVQGQRGMSMIFVTHDLRIAFSTCDRVIVFYAGQIVEVGPAELIDRTPAHPYTLGLLASEPDPARRIGNLAGIPGNVPRAQDVLQECPFRQRCRWATDACASPTALADVAAGHQTACVRYPELRDELAAAHRRAVAAEETPRVAREGESPVCVVTHARRVFARRSVLRSAPPVVAVDDVSFAIGPGESVGLVGESGSGKTTMARCLVGLEQLSDGQVEVAGIDVTRPNALSREQRTAWRQAVQLVFQDPYSSLNPARSVGWALREAIGTRPERVDDLEQEVASLLGLVGLSEQYAARLPRALSGGQRQRVAIARALAVRPRLLVCDEPVSALDVSVQAEILALFRRLQRELGLAYLFITHDLAVLRQVAERAYVMHRGLIVEEGTVDALLEQPQHDYTRRLVAATPRADHDWLERAESEPVADVLESPHEATTP